MNTKQRNNLTIFAILTILGVLYWFLFDFLRWNMFDSPSFTGAARQMFGLENGYNIQSRLSKPLVLIFPGALEYLTSISAQIGFLIQTTLAYYGCGYLINSIIYRLTKNRELALSGMLIYVLSQPFAIFSLMILVDAPGWFISLVIIDKSIKYGISQQIKLKHWVILSAISALGMLIKESVIFSFIFLLFYQLYITASIKKKISHTIIIGLTFILTFLFTQWLTQLFYQDSIIGRLFSQQEHVGFVYYNISNIGQVFRIIDFYWMLVIVGIFSLKKALKTYNIHREIYAFLFALALCLLLMPLYPFIVDRILFMVAPTLVLLALSSHFYFKKLLRPMILVGGILNISIAWLIYKYNLQGLLKWGLTTYFSIIIMILLWQFRFSILKTLRK